MRIHHLNCGTCCPVGGRLFDGVSDGLFGKLVCHCLLIETDAGLVLVDTGLGTRDIEHRHHRLSEFFLMLNNVQLRPEETAIAQIRKMGFAPSDVRHIIISHLDFDHAGGIEDFPNAIVHLTAREKEAADALEGGMFIGRRRYRPQQWNEAANWRLYAPGNGERWNGFETVRELEGLPPEILLVPLSGHTWGHSGVAIDTGKGWLLYAADAYFYRGEMEATYTCTPGLTAYQRLMEVDRTTRLANQTRLRELARKHADNVRIFCAHDAVEFNSMSNFVQ